MFGFIKKTVNEIEEEKKKEDLSESDNLKSPKKSPKKKGGGGIWSNIKKKDKDTIKEDILVNSETTKEKNKLDPSPSTSNN
jgi:hypothetical protein